MPRPHPLILLQPEPRVAIDLTVQADHDAVGVESCRALIGIAQRMTPAEKAEVVQLLQVSAPVPEVPREAQHLLRPLQTRSSY
jgi:hypothetical protein